MNNVDFIKFGYNKIIIARPVMNSNSTYSFHHNILINNDTTFEEYYDSIKDIINNHSDMGSDFNDIIIPTFEILVWNVDNLKNKHITYKRDVRYPNTKFGVIKTHTRGYHTINRNMNNKNINCIMPITVNIMPEPDILAAMDIETIEFYGKQIPVAISLVSDNIKILFIISKTINNLTINSEIDKLWREFFTYLIEHKSLFKTIFVHNLGSFDGYFNYKYLSRFFNPNQICTIMDEDNKFICMSLNLEDRRINWKDSYRIFPVSLEYLSKIFSVKGKISKYNLEFNTLNLFLNEE